MIFCYFLYSWKILFGGVKMVNCYLIHGYVHYRAITSMPMMLSLKIRLTNLWSVTIYPSNDASTILFLHLLSGLENRWQKALVLHKGAIMVCSLPTYSSSDTWRHIILKITIKSLMLTVFYLQICKVTTAVLSSKRAFLHVNVCILLLLFGIGIVSTTVTTILIIKRPIRSIVRNLTHALRVYWHGLVGFLCHSKYFTHAWWRGSCTVDSCNVSF